MKHRLRNQITVAFLGMVMLSLTIIFIINVAFLEDYYVSRKTDALKKAFSELENCSMEDREVSEYLAFTSIKNNLSWILTDATNSCQKYFGLERDQEAMEACLFGYATGLESRKNLVLIEERDNYTIQKSKDRYMYMEYIELWGTLKNGNSCLIRSPIESIRESAEISNRFFVFVGILILCFSIIIIFILTKKLTNPISELTDISQKMANLDFSVVYTSRGRNEIDVLGENFNSMAKQLEATITELKQANFELEKDIADKIEIDKKRKEFLDNVSHELKTPIALIQGYAEGLKDNINDDPESMEFYCDVIIDEAGKMNRMVKQLLNLNQLEAGQDAAAIERFDIVEMVKGVVSKSDILIRQKEARVQFGGEEKLYVWADEFKIEDVVSNFFSNALNHLEGENIIEIRMEKREGKAHISVFNTGQPIPEEDIDQIWNKFYKVDKARTREYGGSGIGLSIVRAVMESHHQKYGVKNYDNGVEFWFELSCD